VVGLAAEEEEKGLLSGGGGGEDTRHNEGRQRTVRNSERSTT